MEYLRIKGSHNASFDLTQFAHLVGRYGKLKKVKKLFVSTNPTDPYLCGP